MAQQRPSGRATAEPCRCALCLALLELAASAERNDRAERERRANIGLAQGGRATGRKVA